MLRKADQKANVKHSSWIQSIFNFISSQIKSDDILPEVKLDDVNNTEMGKASKSVKMRTQILFKISGSMSFKWKKEEESQGPACKINTLKAGINPSSALPTMLSLLKIQCNTYRKI